MHLSAWLVGAWEGTPTNAAPEERNCIGWFHLGALPTSSHAEVLTALVTALMGRAHSARATEAS